MASLKAYTGVLDRARAAHLLRRATFGPTLTQIGQFTNLNTGAAIDLLTAGPEEEPAAPIDTATGATWVDPQGKARADLSNSEQDLLFGFFQAWHMDVMRRSPATLRERITWFLHTHLPARWTEILSSEAFYYQNCLFRHYAYGSFRELFSKICVDNAMLRYLDGYSNRFRSPNENFAREMFELYSIGKGPQVKEGDYTHYTEDDIREATRVLTGWTIDETFTFLDPDTGIPAGKMRSELSQEGQPFELAVEHDPGQKTFTAKFGGRTLQPSSVVEGYPTVEASYAELDEMIGMIFEKQETARFIARKLYRFFVYHFISEEVESGIIEPLSQVLMENNYSLVEALKVLLQSEHFFDMDDAVGGNNIRGALIKSPVDIFTGLFRVFNVTFPDRQAAAAGFYQQMGWVVSKLLDQGLDFYEPFDVAGYDAYHQIPGYNRNWITTYALAHRYQTADLLMMEPGGESGPSPHLDILDWVENSGHIGDPSDAVAIMDVLKESLFAVELTQERYDYLLYTVFLDYPENPSYARGLWSQEWDTYRDSGTDEIVRARLEILLSALVQTPEFQLY
jgi:uncharacterized protein (DUF1800 family)